MEAQIIWKCSLAIPLFSQKHRVPRLKSNFEIHLEF